MFKLSGLVSSAEKKVQQAAHTVEKAAQTAAAKVGNEGRAVGDTFEGAAKSVPAGLGGIQKAIDQKLERPFVTGRDGFVAVDAQGNITGGRAAGVRVADMDAPKNPLDGLLKIISGGESRPATFTLPSGKSITLTADGSGHAQLPLGDFSGKALEQGMNPQRGGLAKVNVTTPDGKGDSANMLVLPKDYKGPIFVCDIDDTLRATSYVDLAENKTQKPIPGAKDLLDQIAAKGVPIIYLSAGPDRIHSQNEAFLKQLPPGILLDRSNMPISGMLPINSMQAKDQGNYKAGVLADLEKTYPQAQLFGMGDDKYGDALAYTKANATEYIHDVQPNHSNLPADFEGTLTQNYTPDFIAKVTSDLQAAIDRANG